MSKGGHIRHNTGSIGKCIVILASFLVASVLSSGTSSREDGASGIVILPRTLKPVHYNVWLQPFINGNFSVHGKVEAEFEVLLPTYHIILHMTDIITRNESSKVTDKATGREVIILQQKYEASRNLYIAHLQEQLEVGRTYVLSLDFVGTVGEQLRGFYRSSYKKENGDISWVASTQFQSTDARRAFPCFDEPGLKATFKIYLAREAHMTALSNMPLVKSTPIEDQPGWLWDEFQKSVPMSTYLVAFAISDFTSKILSDPSSKTIIRAVTRAAVQNKTIFSGDVAVKALSFYEQYYGIEFPLPKIDMITVPENSFNGMENWGLITFRESGFLVDPAKDSAVKKNWVAYLVSHELAHQWFGNLVTLEWWTDLWLNEGFATYMGDVAVDHVEPSWRVMEDFIVNRLQVVMGMDALKSSHPVSVPVNDPIEINEIFDSISYLKGASIIRMMSYFLTESTFKKGVKNYLTALKYKNADQDDLWQFLTDVAYEDGTLSRDMNVKMIMDTWTLKMGFPVITVMRAGNNSAILTQEQFFLGKMQSMEEDQPQRWWIPVTYTAQDNPSFDDTEVKFWLSDRGIYPVSHIGFPNPNHWVIFNVKQSGYYRVNYDLDNWKLLTQQLHGDHEVIHVMNRAQIIDDALNLARAGRLHYEIALEITTYLTKERSYVAWKAALANLQYLHDMFKHDPAYGALRDYMMSVILPIYNHVGFEEQSTDDQQTQLLRGEVLRWACKLRHADCVQRSVRLYKQWMENADSVTSLSSNVKDAVYCTAVREGERSEWKFAWEKKLRSSLACSEHMWLLARYVRGAFNESSGVRRQDAANVFRDIAKESVGNVVAWEFLKSNWEQVADYIGTQFFALPRMVEAVTKSFNTEQKLNELIKFKEENAGNLLTAKRSVEQGIEATQLNVAWMKDNYEDIVHWLRNRGFSSDLSPP